MPQQANAVMTLSQDRLIAILEDPGATEFVKTKACQRLAVVGGHAAVPALADLLADPKLSHYARFALEPMPGEAASQALRAALGGLNGDLLIGVINSIGRRKDTAAIDALAKLRHGDDLAVADAASAALGRIRSL
jgi:HEAT repeat protein